MDNKIFEKIKRSKPFEFNDVFLYLFVLVIVFALMGIFLFAKGTVAVDGFKVTHGEKLILTYSHQDKSVKVEEQFLTLVVLNETDDQITATVYFDADKKAFNVIAFNKNDCSAKVTESNCAGKDCVSFPPLKDNGVIFCNPHGLKILPIGSSGFIPPVTG